MSIAVQIADAAALQPWREAYRAAMRCQIVHDALHERPGWTRSYLLRLDGVIVGYGGVAVGGPWASSATIFAFHVAPRFRHRVFALFAALVAESGASAIEAQTNAVLLTAMLHAFAENVESERILFADAFSTTLAPPGAVVRPRAPEDAGAIADAGLDADAGWIVAHDGELAGAGGILTHYNPPFVDIYMAIAERFRRRGLGAFLVQELKRIAYARGGVPAARCNTSNVASRSTLQKAGFVPCGHVLRGRLCGERVQREGP